MNIAKVEERLRSVLPKRTFVEAIPITDEGYLMCVSRYDSGRVSYHASASAYCSTAEDFQAFETACKEYFGGG